MRKMLFVSALALATITGCSKSSDPTKAAAAATLPTVTVDQLDTMIAANGCQAVDANGEATRKKMGVIPGAVLLADSDKFDANQLGADKAKQFVFYCANTSCGASHEAAEKAITAGYKNVKVLPEGIAGWVKAGKKVSTI